MSFFKNATGINISGGQFNNIRGNFNQWNDNRHTSNVNSNNTTTTNNVNSHNDNSWHGPGSKRHRNDNRRRETKQPRNDHRPYHDSSPPSYEAASEPPREAPMSGGYCYNNVNFPNTTFQGPTRPSGPDHVKSDPQKPLRDPAQEFMSLGVPTSPQEQGSSAATVKSQHAVHEAHPAQQSPVSAATARALEPRPSTEFKGASQSGPLHTPEPYIKSTSVPSDRNDLEPSSFLPTDQSKKSNAGRILAPDKWIEASEPVKKKLAVIKGCEEKSPLFFLGKAVTVASNILLIAENTGFSEIGSDLLYLALDSHALVYIVIDICEKRNLAGQELSQEERTVKYLTQIIQRVHYFMIEVLARGHLDKNLKRKKDTSDILKLRGYLVTWLAHFADNPTAGASIEISGWLQKTLQEQDPLSVSQGGTMLLDLVKQASSLAPLPYLSEAAGLTLQLIHLAQAVKENRKGFQELAHDATQLVAVCWRSYQGAKNQEEWLNNEGIRASARILRRSLQPIIELGERMNSRNIILRISFHIFDANIIKACRQELNTAVTRLQVAAQVDMREILAQIEKTQDELLIEVRNLKTLLPAAGPLLPDMTTSRRAIENENRARQRINIAEMKDSGIALGPGNAIVKPYSL